MVTHSTLAEVDTEESLTYDSSQAEPAQLSLLPSAADEKSEKEKSKTLHRSLASILSPLRYPGAKRRFAEYVAETLRVNNIKPKLFVEPFAGGASVALRLLQDKVVENIGLGEADPLVAGFWQCVFFDTDWLVNEIQSIEVTLDQWRSFRAYTPTNNRENAIACIFLNRTSFSGILCEKAGPIGGKHQKNYSIACRFNKETVIRRIRQAAALKDQVAFVKQADWQETIQYCNTLHANPGVFIYLDPPFYKKASALYRFYFNEQHHQDLHDALAKCNHDWLLSYDLADEIRHLYADFEGKSKCVELLYTASSQSKPPVKELVITNLQKLPHHDRLWRTAKEWGRSNAA